PPTRSPGSATAGSADSTKRSMRGSSPSSAAASSTSSGCSGRSPRRVTGAGSWSSRTRRGSHRRRAPRSVGTSSTSLSGCARTAGGPHDRQPNRRRERRLEPRPMRMALLGAGRIGQLHGRLLAAQPKVDEVVIWDIDVDRAREAASAINGLAAPSLEEALRGADAAVIAASTNAHATLARETVDRRMPTFCEKPLAFDLPETLELVARIEAAGVPFQVGFQRRFDPAYREARRLVESGDLGTVYLVRLIA